MSKEAMKLALEALEANSLLVNGNNEKWGLVGCMDGYYSVCFDIDPINKQTNEAITALREALANEALERMAENARELGLDYEPAQQEPVACRYGDNGYACCEGGPCAAEEHNDKTDWQERGMVAEAALAKLLDEKNEPVAWATQMNEYGHIHWGAKRPEYPMVYEFPLYTSPPAQRKPLTDEEIIKCWGQVSGTRYGYVAFARAIEAKLKEKNNG